MTPLMTYNLAAREVLNGAVFPLSLALSLIIALYLFDTWLDHGKGWTKQPGVQTACALCWVFTAEMMRAGCAWWALRATNDGVTISPEVDHFLTVVLIVSTFMLIATMLRCVHLFRPNSLGQLSSKLWLIVAGLTAIFLFISDITGV